MAAYTHHSYGNAPSTPPSDIGSYASTAVSGPGLAGIGANRSHHLPVHSQHTSTKGKGHSTGLSSAPTAARTQQSSRYPAVVTPVGHPMAVSPPNEPSTIPPVRTKASLASVSTARAPATTTFTAPAPAPSSTQPGTHAMLQRTQHVPSSSHYTDAPISADSRATTTGATTVSPTNTLTARAPPTETFTARTSTTEAYTARAPSTEAFTARAPPTEAHTDRAPLTEAFTARPPPTETFTVRARPPPPTETFTARSPPTEVPIARISAVKSSDSHAATVRASRFGPGSMDTVAPTPAAPPAVQARKRTIAPQTVQGKTKTGIPKPTGGAVLPGTLLRATIKNVDMAPEMQACMINVAQDALSLYTQEKDMAAYTKKTLDAQFGPTWQSIVGKKFGSYVTHEEGHFIYFCAFSPCSCNLMAREIDVLTCADIQIWESTRSCSGTDVGCAVGTMVSTYNDFILFVGGGHSKLSSR